jgi:hypothetical protein
MDISKFQPFQNDSQIATIDDLTFENFTTEIVVSGSIVITKDPSDLARLDEVIALLQHIRNNA